MIARLAGGILALALLAPGGAALGQEADEEKRSAIVEVEGVVMLDENLSIKKIREMAYMQARRKAAKNALIHVKSYTRMENFQVTEDLIESYANAQVRVLEDKDIGIENNRYKVWIRAEVRYDARAQPPRRPEVRPVGGKPAKPELEPLTVRIWTDRRFYRKGQKVAVFIRGNRDFYGQLFYEDADGNIIRLLPNAYRREHFFKGGKVYEVPGDDDKFELTVTPPFGPERMTVYASTQPTAELDGENIGAGLSRAAKGGAGLDTRGKKNNREKVGLGVRALAVRPAAGGKLSKEPVEFFEAVWRITTSR